MRLGGAIECAKDVPFLTQSNTLYNEKTRGTRVDDLFCLGVEGRLMGAFLKELFIRLEDFGLRGAFVFEAQFEVFLVPDVAVDAARDACFFGGFNIVSGAK